MLTLSIPRGSLFFTSPQRQFETRTQYLLTQLKEGEREHPVPDLLNATFHVVDSELSKLAAEDGTHSGCTAVTAFLRLEDENGNAVETDNDPDSTVGSSVTRGGAGHHDSPGPLEDTTKLPEDSSDAIPASAPSAEGALSPSPANTGNEGEEERKRKFGDGFHRDKIKSLFGGGSGSERSNSQSNAGKETTTDTKRSTNVTELSTHEAQQAEGIKKPARAKNMARRTLYTANVGDARAVLRCALTVYSYSPTKDNMLIPYSLLSL